MNNRFSRNLKKIRKDNNLSQEQLADELGVSRQAISKWESAAAYPEMDKIITLCEKFNLNIDDLLHKDIREVKGEEESKRNLNKYVDDFLNFVTNTINLFSDMSFKSKCKCLFEQCVIALALFIIFALIGVITSDLLSGIFGIFTSKIYFALRSIINFIYFIFCLSISLMILLHIFKTRYLYYYEKMKNKILNESDNEKDETTKHENERNNDKTLFKRDENKIIIRDPKHSEYKFINGIFKGIVTIIKFFVLCFSFILFISLICLFSLFVISFLVHKTELFFIGLLISIISVAIINIIFILLSLNFVFNRKNDKKKMIWTFIISLITFGIGLGFTLVGVLDFEYIQNDKNNLETEYLELDMRDDLILRPYEETEYIESDNDNIKIEYTINKYCNIEHSNFSDHIVNIWGNCNDPIKLTKEFIQGLNNKKIISINSELSNVKIYTTKENIILLKNNYNEFVNPSFER